MLVGSKIIGNMFWAYRYMGGMVQFHYDSKTPLQPGQNIIGTLPVGYRPYTSGYWAMSTGNTYDCRLSIRADGTVSCYNYSSGAAANTLSSGLYVTTDAVPASNTVELEIEKPYYRDEEDS